MANHSTSTPPTDPNLCTESTKLKLKLFHPNKKPISDEAVKKIHQLIATAPDAYRAKLNEKDILMLCPASIYHLDKDGNF